MSSLLHQTKPLTDRNLLVVEDEYFLGGDVVDALAALGARTIGPIGELKEAEEIVENGGPFDAAVIDINLRQEPTYPLARLLRVRGIPFLFTTGYDRSSVPLEFQDIPLWEKPINLPALMRELVSLINIQKS
jgi:hypothetical protein